VPGPASNPYRPPVAPPARGTSADVIPRPPGLLIVAIIEALGALAAAIGAPHVLGEFRALFEGFGAGLSGTTRFALGSSWVWALLALCAIGLAVAILAAPQGTRARFRRLRLATTALIVTIAVAVIFYVVALYLPIFELGAVV
jgi:type II secretory pathway component PulF